MKKTLLILFAVAIASVNMMAQEPQDGNTPKRSPEERATKMLERMTKELVLTADQQTKMKALILKREKEREERMKEEKARMDKMDAEIKAILTPEQYQKFEQKKKEMRQNHMKKRMAAPAK
jgi:Spy/CpxP family protein refolding chaperone